jgi:hypothetical protein
MESSAGSFADSDTFLFSDRCEDCDYGLAENPRTIEVLLRVGSPVDSERREAIEVGESFEHSLAGETVEGPKEEHVEFSLRGVAPHLLEPVAVGLRSGFLVAVFGYDLPALRVAELAELAASPTNRPALCLPEIESPVADGPAELWSPETDS